ncbi:helix-turn-helix domain-containing protein [Calidifontibacter sp. DB0510]|uniref:Helix-turn-helix domain-containing protein n=1 Tax=Metallococcus carri TaxID=1656884 RepID=A0A967B1W4_9MICO|nr:helix-turn-helix domain-containing protein [Metallococcus carri]NHN57299.1 helix-turn-helix domain-containing protein [Metallococcus carri]NOP38096.1 helix-turn-helix domain-containing protein [Calidifontibacter sp. DB2511S]
MTPSATGPHIDPTGARVVGEVGLLDYADCQVSAIHGLRDIFRVASEHAVEVGDPPSVIRVSTWSVTATDDGPVTECTSDTHPDLEHRLSHVIIPPSLIVPELMTSVSALTDWLVELRSEGTTLCAVCAGVFVLAETHLLDSRDATTHWAFAEELAERHPEINVDASRMVIDDVDIVTAAGILAWVDLGLTLVDRMLGPSVMLHTARFVLADPPRRQQSLYGEFTPRLQHGDAEIREVQQRVHAALHEPLVVDDLARTAAMHPRTFQRRFKQATGMTATAYLQAARIAKARESLELTTDSVAQIARSVGYLDVSNFRKVFQRAAGVTPSEYRNRFSIAAHR